MVHPGVGERVEEVGMKHFADGPTNTLYFAKINQISILLHLFITS